MLKVPQQAEYTRFEMAEDIEFSTPITRYYIDTRRYILNPSAFSTAQNPLPLLSTLPLETQGTITRFLRLPDRYMALASALMKHLFIHRTAKIPWSEVKISRTPKPHNRPYWDVPKDWHGEGFEGLEFNVSHQAGMVVLAGCQTPHRPRECGVLTDNERANNAVRKSSLVLSPDPDSQSRLRNYGEVRVGVDVACSNEPKRTPDLSTQDKFDDWVDTFAEVFSDREIEEMKHRPVPVIPWSELNCAWGGPWAQLMCRKARRFYTYWALKEAYIKMVGEGLLAEWLKELEFEEVVAPAPDQHLDLENEGTRVIFKGKDITDSLQVDLEGFGQDFIIATMIKGVVEEKPEMMRWKKLDIMSDVRPCAEGTCSCLD